MGECPAPRERRRNAVRRRPVRPGSSAPPDGIDLPRWVVSRTTEEASVEEVGIVGLDLGQACISSARRVRDRRRLFRKKLLVKAGFCWKSVAGMTVLSV